MSKESVPLEVNKCISSRLWYTTLIFLETNVNDNSFKESIANNCTELQLLLKRIISENDDQFKWILRMLLLKVINITSLNTDHDLQIKLNHLSMINAIKLCNNVSVQAQQELLLLLQTTTNVSCRVSKFVNALSEESLISLKKCLNEKPGLLCWIINELCRHINNFPQIHDALQDLYFVNLKDFVQEVTDQHLYKQCKESYLFKEKQTINEKRLGFALCILSKMRLTEPKENDILTKLFPVLLRVQNSKDMELAFYCREDVKLSNKWFSFVDKAYARSELINTLDTALYATNAIFEFQHNSVALLQAKELVQRISRRKSHWLNDILDISYMFTIQRKYEEVTLVLSCHLINAIYPVLLFKIFNQYLQKEINSTETWRDILERNIFVCDSLRFIIHKCNFTVWNDSVLSRLDVALKNHIKVVEYILNWKKIFITGESSNSNMQLNVSEQTVSTNYILHLLQNFSVLKVLKITSSIYEKDYNEIQNMLREVSESENIFQAYYSILSALKAVLLCESYNINYQYIIKHFSDMKFYLQSLFPLTLRLKTIENIFSLLFMRQEDFNVISNDVEDSINISNEKSRSERRLTEQSRTGFVCNKYAVRDMLHHLKNSILATGIEHTRQKREIGFTEELDRIHKKISAITKAVTDATWRLELYTNSSFIENIGISEDEFQSTHIVKESDVFLTEKTKFLYYLKHKNKPFFYQEEDNSLEDTKVKSDSGSESGLIYNNTRWRKRLKSIVLTGDNSVAKDIGYRPFFINFMLASKENLILQSLWKSDYIKAQEVIEMFNMKNTHLDGEIRFSKALQLFRQEVSKHSSVSSTDFTKKNTKSSTLENIRLVAQEGIQSSKHTNQLETFLASQETNLRLINTDNLNSNEILILSVLDLALTIGHTCQTSINLCDVAIKYLKLHKTFDNSEHAHFFMKVYQLLYENKNEMSVIDILCDAKILLSVKDWKEKNEIWRNLNNKYHEFKESQKNIVITDTKLKNNNYLLGFKILKKIITICNNNEKYLQYVYSHLQQLTAIIPTSTADTTVSTILDLLKISLHFYFGHQIYDLNIEPDKLETIAKKLQVNLIYSILINICPRLLYDNNGNEKSNIHQKTTGCITLNKSLGDSELSDWKIKNPNQCVLEILTEFVQILHDLTAEKHYINYTNYDAISKYPQIQAVLNKTSHLANIDLSELSIGDETLTFFLNTWNLMFLHASLIIWGSDPPFNKLQHKISLMSVGYIIGDLGLVTLSALRSKLLGTLTPDLKLFLQFEELNEPAWQDLDLAQDPRMIFAMAHEFHGTPQIHIFEAKKLNETLDQAARDYIDHYLQHSTESIDHLQSQKTILLLPDLVQQYQHFFTHNLKSPSTKNYKHLFSVNEYLKLDENMTIRYVSPYYSYEIFLRYAIHVQSTVKNKNEVQSSVWQIHTIRPSLLQYLEGHCWLLSYLVQRMHNENPTILENSCDNLKRTACLENLLNSVWVEKLKALFDNNQILAAIHEAISVQKLWSHLETLLQNGYWSNCLEIINALPDSTTTRNIDVQILKDKILSQLVSTKETMANANMLQYLYQINDIHILTQTILHNISKWHVNVCEYALLHALHHVDNNKLPLHCKQRMQEILCRITIFHKMLPYCVNTCNSTWFDVMYCTEKINSNQIIKSLINADKFELCLEWLECQEFSLDIQSSFTQDFLVGLLRNENHNFQQALKLLQALPLGPSIKMCKSVLKNLDSINALQFVTNYLLEHCKTADTMKYRRTLVGIDILKILEEKERPLYIHLIKEPLLMLEQLLMNCKFESIQKILNEICDKLHQTDISISKFDMTVRFYATKSLDFRVSLQRDGIENKSKNWQHSILETSTNEFVMPITVPTKEEWVPNDKARECSCCKAVIFSMFNRRHHCRRCGRVVCAVCSQHRMQVSGYPSSMLVRVCDDCKQQTVLQMRAVQGVPSTPSSETFDYWRLTRDEIHNQTIREEFSFEYAPNISLCLAILNLHSDHKAYTSFLLDRCDEMKRLLQPVSGKVNPEIDHAVIIKMIRSLLVAAKVKCAKLGLNTGLAHCDRFLSQVDLISTLVQSDCLALIPTDDLDDHTLRKLRDLLTEKEQWTLALDVSTKAGLDTQGVWATWGKACLKIGYFEQARDKFYHCLDKILYEYHDDWVVLSYPRESTSKSKEDVVEGSEKNGKNEFAHTKKSEHSKLRPVKDPPLLTEILQILDTLNTHKHHMQYFYQFKSDSALEMLNTLSGLKATSLGQFSTKQPNVQNIYYQESLYYLLTYGSYSSILKFFLKHEEFDKCLTYVLDNNLEPDLFFNGVYLYCLKNGIVDKLHNAMKAQDSSVLSWRKYLIYVCHCLEKKQYLNILYELQLFMKDCIRAAMTCILFYTNGANSYTDLCSRGQLLLDAQKHLESQVEYFNRGRRKSTSSFHGNQSVFTMEMEPSEIDRHINTIWRQMEIAKFLRNSENEGRAPVKFLNLFPDIDYNTSSTLELPTLFGNQQQKIHLAVLAILCGCNVEEGFGIAFRIMQDYNLPQQKIYSLAGHVLALNNNVGAIEQLIKCCRSSGTPNSNVISDYVLTHCVKLFLNRTYNEPELKINIDSLIRLIIDIELKISAYIESKQLKAAYLLAVKHSRVQDIRKILKESDRLGQNAIKAICLKWLQQYQQVKQ